MMDEMVVTRVLTEHGGHIEPPLDESWSDLDKLRWWAAAVAVDTGLRVSVSESEQRTRRHGRWVPERGLYSVSVGSSFRSGATFNNCWTFLSGVCTGAQQARRHE